MGPATYGPAHDDIVRDWLRRFEPARDEHHRVSIPIEAHADWRQAVIAASHRHCFNQLIAALPHVDEDYSQRATLGIGLAAPDDGRYRDRDSRFAHQEARIREGRRLLGEPDDLNF